MQVLKVLISNFNIFLIHLYFKFFLSSFKNKKTKGRLPNKKNKK